MQISNGSDGREAGRLKIDDQVFEGLSRSPSAGARQAGGLVNENPTASGDAA